MNPQTRASITTYREPEEHQEQRTLSWERPAFWVPKQATVRNHGNWLMYDLGLLITYCP